MLCNLKTNFLLPTLALPKSGQKVKAHYPFLSQFIDSLVTSFYYLIFFIFDIIAHILFLYNTIYRIILISITKKLEIAFQLNFLLWLGWLDSNQRITESKSVALPLGDTPRMVGIARFELAAPCSQGRCATGLRYIPLQMTLLVYHIQLALSNNFLRIFSSKN